MTSPVGKSIEVSSVEVAAVARWASLDETRPHLRMVLFANNEYVATDGHRLVRVPCETHDLKIGVDRAQLIAAVVMQRELPPTERGRTIKLEPYPAGDGHQLRVRISLSDHVYVVVRGQPTNTYPPVDRVMPPGKVGNSPPAVYSLNPEFFAAVSEVIAGHLDTDELGGKMSEGVDITGWGGSLDPIQLTSAKGAQFVIMPMRGPLFRDGSTKPKRKR